jgi:very-short-patch-repair endonuclease
MKEIYTYSKHLKPAARQLRKNMTQAESVIWAKIRRKQICNIHFTRQKPIQCYILDFYAKAPNLAIELDGEIHNTEQSQVYDKDKESMLKDLGIKVIRFTNTQIMHDLKNVIKEIEMHIESLI